MFLKKKRLDGKVKWQTVDGGNKLQSYIPKEDASLPTIATKSVLMTCITDAYYGRDVSVIDIPNAFIKRRVENEKDKSFIKILGILVDIICEIDPHYRIYVARD